MPTPTISHDDFLTAWIEAAGNPAAILKALRIPPTELFRMLCDPAIEAHLAEYERSLARHARVRALTHQGSASACIASGLTDTDPAERRRAATTLARIAHQTQTAARAMLKSASDAPSRTTPEDRETRPPSTPAPSHAVHLTPHPSTQTHTRTNTQPLSSRTAPNTAADLRTRAGATG